MKNYYELLGVNQEFTEEELEQSFIKKQREAINHDEKSNALIKAYKTLKDSETRAKYDEKLSKASLLDTLKKNKVRFIGGALVLIAIGGAGYAIGRSSHKEAPKKETTSTIADIITNNNNISSYIAENNKNIEEEMQQNEEVTIEITADMLQEKIDQISANLQAKGLNYDEAALRSCLFIVNADYISIEESQKLFDGQEINTVVQMGNACSFMDSVFVYNIMRDNDHFISMKDFTFDKEDSAIEETLENKFLSFRKNMNDNTMMQTNFDELHNDILSFYEMTNDKEDMNENYFITTSEGEFDYSSLSFGGKFLIEMGPWSLFSETFRVSGLQTDEQIKRLESFENIQFGTRYSSPILNKFAMVCPPEELEQGKVK